jgi:repressor LexA
MKIFGSITLQLNCGGIMALTKRQFQVLAFLDSFTKRNGYCPSFDEIGKGLNLSSLATVHKHIGTLEKKGFIRRGYNQSRSIEILNPMPLQRINVENRKGKATVDSKPGQPAGDFELPLLGCIAAGQPLEAVSNPESISLKEFGGKSNIYALKVKGNSMIEDHICDGDLVLVETVHSAENGDTIVALIDNNEATLKRFYREKNSTVRLQPANANMRPIIIKEQDLKIQGRVIGVLRKY